MGGVCLKVLEEGGGGGLPNCCKLCKRCIWRYGLRKQSLKQEEPWVECTYNRPRVLVFQTNKLLACLSSMATGSYGVKTIWGHAHDMVLTVWSGSGGAKGNTELSLL